MVAHFSLLVMLVLLVEEIPMPASSVTSVKRGRGRPPVYHVFRHLKATPVQHPNLPMKQ